MRLETDRLILRLATLGDAHFFLKLLNEAEYIKNIRDSKVRTIDDALKFIEEFYIKSYRTNGFGLYLLQLKDTQELIGVCGLVKRDSLPYPDLGFALLSSHTGHGYIAEGAQAVISFAIHELKLPLLGAITTKTNIKSSNVLKKLGFHFIKDIQFETGEPLDLFELSL